MSSDASNDNPIYGPFFGVMGAASAIIFSGKFFFLIIPNCTVPSPRSKKLHRKGHAALHA